MSSNLTASASPAPPSEGPQLGMVSHHAGTNNRAPSDTDQQAHFMNTTPARPAAAEKARLLGGLLRSWGQDADDFEVEEDRNPALAELFGMAGGVVVVRRRSTGEERLYATGIGSAWFGTLLMDLSRGHFAAPRRAPGQAMAWQ